LKRTLHDLRHYHLTTFDMGQLVPVSCVEALPGDTFQGETSALVRVTPQLKPLMHPVDVRIHHFFVNNRILWSDWEGFITGATSTNVPTISGGAHTEGDLSDYLGVYDDASNTFNALPVRAYNKIYNEYYRDKDIISEVSEDTNTVQKALWEKDYFTTARAEAQQGTAVSLPLGTSAPVMGIGLYGSGIQSSSSFTARESDGVADSTTGWVHEESPASAGDAQLMIAEGTTGYPNVYADLSNATAATIAELRNAMGLQKYAEARAIYGDDYVSYLRYYGIKPSDARLNRPEYLAGGKVPISFSEILNQTGANTPGAMVGHGVGAVKSNRFRYFCEEHGWIMTIMSVMPKAVYVNNLPRKWSRSDKEDYWTRELEGVGAQTVLNKETYAAHSTPDGTFGYQGRYDEYRSEQSRVSAEMRNSTNYDWHMGRIFGGDTALNSSFLECSPTKRCFADQTEDSLWVMVNNDFRARRMVSRRSWTGGVR
jgi:hypothetical protein